MSAPSVEERQQLEADLAAAREECERLQVTRYHPEAKNCMEWKRRMQQAEARAEARHGAEVYLQWRKYLQMLTSHREALDKGE